MMQERDIMTIRSRKIFSSNLFEENDSFILSDDSYSCAPELQGNISALTYISESVEGGVSTAELDEENAKVAKSDLVKSLFSGYELYLFASDSIWQPATRITRHYGLWKRLKKLHKVLEAINDRDFSQEHVKEGSEGLQFSGIARLGIDNLDLGIALVRDNIGFQLYLSKHSLAFESERVGNYFEVAYLKELSFNGSPFNVDSFIAELISNNSALVRVAGSGELAECSIDIIASSSSELFIMLDT